MLTDGRTNGQTNGKADAYVAKSGGQGDVSCRVLWLFSLVVDLNTNFDINVERWHKCWQTDGKADAYIAPCYKQVLQKLFSHWRLEPESTLLSLMLPCPWLSDILTLIVLSPDIPCLCKQCRSRSVGFWRSQLIWICTVCHLVCEFTSTIQIKISDWLNIRSECGILIYSAGHGLISNKSKLAQLPQRTRKYKLYWNNSITQFISVLELFKSIS